MGQSNVKYSVCCTDKWYLMRNTDDKQFDVILSDRKPDLLNKLCDSLNNEAGFTVPMAVEMYCQERRDCFIYDYLNTMLDSQFD